MSAITPVTSASLFSSTSNWIGDTMTAILNSQNQGGMMGALQNAGDGSIDSFLSSSTSMANSFALITQGNTTNAGAFYAKLAAQNLQKRQDEQFKKAMADLEAANSMVKPKSLLDPIIFFDDGSTIDTTTNVLTMVSGKQVDITTGAEVVDPTYVIQMANGAYLNTQTNVLTMPDGTRIDTVTGLRVDQLDTTA